MTATATSPSHKRSWRQFSLRTLLALIFLCALALGFWRIYIQPYRHEARIIAQLQEHGAGVTTEPDGPLWTRRIAGDEFCRRIVRVEFGDPRITAADLLLLTDAPNVRTITILDSSKITARDLRHLTAMKRLRDVTISGPAGTDEGLRHIGGLKNLESLTIHGSFDDTGVKQLDGLHKLQSLKLSSVRMSDGGLAALQSLTNLRELRLVGPITDAGMRHLEGLNDLEILVCEGDPAKAKISKELTNLMHLECVNTPVPDAMEYLSLTHGVPIRIDERELEAAERIPLEPLTVNIGNAPFTPLHEGLDRILGPRQLDWTFSADEILITTKEAAERSRAGVIVLQQKLPKLKQIEVQW